MSASIPIRSRPPYRSDVGRAWLLTGHSCSSYGQPIRASFRRAWVAPAARPPRGPGGGCRSFRLGFGLVLAQRVPAQLDPVGVVNDAVEDRVAQGRVSDDGVPVGRRDLTGDQQRLPAVAFLD